jgi:hypothetical protein
MTTEIKKEAFKFFSESYTNKVYRLASKLKKKQIERPVNQIKEILIEQEKERKLHPVIKHRPENDRIRQLREELANIHTVRKERVFDSEPTEEEKLIIQKRVQLQQLQFQEYEKKDFYRKLDKIVGLYNFLNEEEVKAALEDSNNDEEQVILNLTQQDYIAKIRKVIAYKNCKTEIESVEMTNEEKEAYEKLATKRRNYMKKITSQDTKTRTYTYTRLRLDDALKQLKSDDPLKAFEGWSEARIKAYKMIGINPNTYYYRFNAPGEKQRNGAWNPEERKLFMERLAEVGADGQWGIFSMTIPGRVGYQCSNFYRHLLKSKQIIDPNYIIDGKTMHYLFGKKDGQVGTIRRHNRHPHKKKVINLEEALSNSSSSSSTRTSTRASTRTTRKRKSKYTYNDSDSDDDYLYPHDNDKSGTYHNWCTTKRTRAKYEQQPRTPEENPLPGFTDPITLEEVIKPAISPYGHVMGYDSWVRCLNNPDCKNKCPIIKKPLTKRELVILTFENIDQYRDKIINK